jgi:hypothetical protein
MRYRDIAWLTGIQFSFDLTTLPAVAEDALIRAINEKDDRVLIRKTKDPFDNDLYR